MARPGSATLPRTTGFLTVAASVLVAGAILYWARAVLIPVALAVLVTFLLAPIVIRLQRVGVPKLLAVILVVVAAFAIAGGIGWVVTAQVVGLAGELPQHEETIVAKAKYLKTEFGGTADRPGLFDPLLQLFERVQRRVEREAPGPDGTSVLGDGIRPIPVQVEPEEDPVSRATRYLAPILEPVATAGLVVVLVIFMLLRREDLRNRIVTLSGQSHLAVTTKALDEAGQRIARFLLMQFVINVSQGVAVAVGLALLGVDYAILWGVAAGLLRYIPYLGPIVAGAAPVAYSVLTSDGWWTPLGVVALIVVLELFSNNVLEPLLYGRNVGVSEVAVILSAVFWAWMWGPVGLMLATPLTACLVVAGRYVPALSVLTRVFGDEPDFEPHVVYYQRLLARDEDEAEDVLEEQVERVGFEAACERVVIPALELAKRDRMRNAIDAGLAGFIVESVEEHLAEMRPPSPPADEADAAEAAEADDRPLVFGYAVRDAEDEVAVTVLSKLLADVPVRFEVLSRDRLLSEVVAEVRDRKPAGVCLVGLPPGGFSQVRSLCKRLRLAEPDLKVAVGRWCDALADRHRIALRDQGATYVGRTPTETRDQVVSMGRLRPAAADGVKTPVTATV